MIESYLKEIYDIYSDYLQNHILRKLGDSLDPKIHMKAYTAHKKVPGKIIPIKKEIEKGFKELLEQ